MARAFVSASGQYLEAGTAVVAAVPLTIAAWIRPANVGVVRAIVSLSNSAANEWFTLYQQANSKSAAYQYDNAVVGLASATPAMTNGVWYHVGGVFASNSSRTSYFNGADAVTNTTACSPAGAMNRTAVGAVYFGGTPTNASFPPFDGDIAEVAMWNVALTADEMAMLALGVSPLLVRPAALVAYWPLLGQTSPEIELRGRNELTVTGATAAPHPRIYVPACLYPVARVILRYIAGVTKDSTGAALGGCTVKLFRTSDDVWIATTTSDGSGNYSFTVPNTATTYYVVAYKAGSPDVTGTTVNTLLGV